MGLFEGDLEEYFRQHQAYIYYVVQLCWLFLFCNLLSLLYTRIISTNRRERLTNSSRKWVSRGSRIYKKEWTEHLYCRSKLFGNKTKWEKEIYLKMNNNTENINMSSKEERSKRVKRGICQLQQVHSSTWRRRRKIEKEEQKNLPNAASIPFNIKRRRAKR